MRNSRRTQPLRATRKRKISPALVASQKGAPKYLTTTHQKRRAAMRKRKRRARKRRQTPTSRILGVRKQTTRPSVRL